MDLAKPGLIKHHCGPNAIASFYEYLLDYATSDTVAAGKKLISDQMGQMDDACRKNTQMLLTMLDQDKRDVFV